MTEFTGVNDTEITDFNGLKALGDEKASALVQALQSGQGAPGTGTVGSGGAKTSGAVSLQANLLLVVYSFLLFFPGYHG
jgi:hypothetical protein